MRPLAATLLKVHTLHAAARQVAAVCALLVPGAGALGEGPASQVGTTLRMRAGHLATVYLLLAGALIDYARTQQEKELAEPLLAALVDSRLLGHISRLVLLMRPTSPGAPPAPQLSIMQTQILREYCTVLLQLGGLAELLGRNTVASGRTVVGPCGQRAMLLLCGSALSAADGQPCGLPLGPLLSTPATLTTAVGYTCVSGDLLCYCLAELRQQTEVAGPSLSPRAILRLALRAMALAGAAARAGAGALVDFSGGQNIIDVSWAGGRRKGTQAFRQLLEPQEVESAGRQAMEVLASAAKRWPHAWDAEAGQAWAPLLTGILHFLEATVAAKPDERLLKCVGDLAELLHVARRPLSGGEGEPPVLVSNPALLPRAMTAAARGGLLPLLETMLRCTCSRPTGPEVHVARLFLVAGRNGFATLLAHSPPRQAASFLRTLAKLLRTLPPGALLGTEALTAATLAVMALTATVQIADCALTCLGSPQEEPAEPPGGPEHHAPLFVMALAVLQLLPEIARLAFGATQQLRLRGEPGSGGGSGDGAKRGRGGQTLADLLYPGAGLVERAVAIAGANAMTHAAGVHVDATCSALCLPFLVEECEAVPLLGTALDAALRERTGEQQPTRHTVTLAGSCLAVCQHYPHLVRGRGCGADGGSGEPKRDGDRQPTAAPAAAEAWSTEALRLVATRLGDTRPLLRRSLEEAVEVLEQSGGHVPVHASWSLDNMKALAVGAEALAALRAEAAELLPVCANPACASLEGDSEADVRLQQCARCRRVSYCCRECQMAHWRAGHKAECKT
ncbi:hypothetical protein HYH03_013895 [Edaphochlamys debaryana]|uniref:phytol kinase n=1 Tax=Edaphochlamys debaryana TaxID=47281 RepID=A0A835XNU0_9CHLO|nr:hypothetical protein HYH03_013895 [Edaphochlamys debaryana]|eukprot:KAG2487473.1 hypothetical protein HYH03_013895 [Edaphochlamys debaryana]